MENRNLSLCFRVYEDAPGGESEFDYVSWKRVPDSVRKGKDAWKSLDTAD